MYTNADCTIFLQYIDKAAHTEKYRRVVLYGVMWEDAKAVNVVKSGLTEADRAIIYIPFLDPSTGNMREGYQKPKVWEKDPVNGWTLRPGDVIVKGVVDFSGTMVELSKQYDDVLKITSVDTCDYGSLDMQHWEVGAK